MTRIKLKYNPAASRRGKAKKSKALPTRTPRRARSPSLSDLSDDGGYSALEDISDNDDDENDVVAAEERHLTAKHKPPPRPVPSDDDDEDAEDADVDDDDDEDDEDDDGADEEDEFHGFSDDDDEVGAALDEGDHADAPKASRPTVRFAGVPSSDSESTDDDDDPNDHSDFFPDLFISKGDLDPSFRREVDLAGESLYPSDLGPIYDDDDEFDSEDEFADMQVRHQDSPAQDGGQDGSAQELANDDGYESEGDTTEDDVPEPLPLSQLDPPEGTPTSESEDTTVLLKKRRGKPRVANVRLNRMDKPTAVYNAKARRVVFFAPRLRAPKMMSPPVAQDDPFQFTPFLPGQPEPFIMDLLSTYNAAMTRQLQRYTEQQSWEDYSPEEEEEDDDEIKSEDDLDLGLFLQWDDEEESEHENEQDDDGKSHATRESSSAAANGTGGADHISHLTSLMPDKMGSFRRNQADQTLIFSERATVDSMAFSGPYNATAVRGIKSDRIGTAMSSLTPLRRRHQADSRKRSAGAMDDGQLGHKRQRTLSNM